MSDSTKSSTNPSQRQLWLYALPALPLALPTLALYINLPTWYHEQWGLSLGLIAAIILGARFSDLILDPMVGHWSDRLTRYQQKLMVMVGGIICIPTALLLVHPLSSLPALSLTLGLVGLYLGWTLIQIPYLSWIVGIAPNSNSRLSLASARELLGLLGLLLSALIPAVLVYLGASASTSIQAIVWFALAMGVVTIPLMLKTLTFNGQSTAAESTSIMYIVRRNKPARLLVTSWFLNGLANGIPAVIFPIYITDVLMLEDSNRAYFIAAYFTACICSMAVWLKLSKKIDRLTLWRYAMVICAVAFVPATFLTGDSAYVFIPICLITGGMLAADLAIPHAIQADVADYHAWRFKLRCDNTLFALWNMVTKLALALSAGLAFGLLELANKDPFIIALIYALLPAVLKILSVINIRNFKLSAKSHAHITAQLNKRNH